MKPSELHGMSDDVLAMTLSDTEKTIFNLRFLASTDKKNTASEVKKAKKDIARAKFEQRRRQLDKYTTLSDDQLVAATLAAGETFDEAKPGKRRALRLFQRLSALRAGRPTTTTSPAPTAATAPATGKGQ
jgi:ribosomal protein L29